MRGELSMRTYCCQREQGASTPSLRAICQRGSERGREQGREQGRGGGNEEGGSEEGGMN